MTTRTPTTVRNPGNHTDETHVWLAFGAPPVGTTDDFGVSVVEGGLSEVIVDSRRDGPARIDGQVR